MNKKIQKGFLKALDIVETTVRVLPNMTIPDLRNSLTQSCLNAPTFQSYTVAEFNECMKLAWKEVGKALRESQYNG